jgi:nicotinamide mononucleotide transporter
LRFLIHAPCISVFFLSSQAYLVFMDLSGLASQFIAGLQATTPLEFIAVIAGIVSVWFSKRANIWVYPIGLINTSIFVYLSLKQHLFGEASVNVYYTVMSLYGWWNWSRTDSNNQQALQITLSNSKEWVGQLIFFGIGYLILFSTLTALKDNFAPGAIPWADALASASAYTGMWLMTRKKVESWIWWIITNLCSIPLYFVKGYVFTTLQFFILLLLAIAGWWEWRRKAIHA